MIEATDRVPRQSLRVVGHRISFAEAGSGAAVLLLHGNATYSYAWRNVIPFLAHNRYCIAPDLPGMGESDPILPSGPSTYGFDEQVSLIGMFIDTLDISGQLVIVGCELGGTMAIQLARKLRDRVAGLVLIEGAFRKTTDTLFPSEIQHLLEDLRGPNGEQRVLNENAAIEEYLPLLTLRRLGEEMDHYRQPYPQAGEGRRAMLSLIRQLPLKSTPGPIDDRLDETRLWCAQTRIPKLVIGGNPGFLVPPAVLGTAAKWAETTVASIRGRHLLMEDAPARLTALIVDWLDGINHRR